MNVAKRDELPILELPAPRLVVGHSFGAEPYEHHRIVAGAMGPDRILAIADAGKRQVSVFSSDGSYLLSVGRSGDGPGELRAISAMYVDSGGAISVYDPRASRITRWRSNGELDRVVPVPWLAKGPLHVVHLTPGGEALGLRSEIEIENEMPKLVGLWRSNAVAVNLNRELHLQDTLAVFPGSERYYYGMRGYKQARFTMPLLAARPVYAFHGDCLYALIAEGVTIGEFCRPARGVRRRFEWPQADLDVSKDAFVRHGSATFERRARQSLAAADFLRTYPFDIPDKRPPAGGLVVDEAGYLWLADFFEVDAAASDWVIFDPTGVLRIRLHNPHIYRILSIGRDYLLALQRVELDVEQVVLYDLPTEWR